MGRLQGTQPELYEGFLAKFERKRTTDDCLTPAAVYDAVRGWVFARYGLDPGTPVVRPFWPDRDYEHEDYPDGCVVLDNPPFSIVGQIVRFFNAHGVRYFLFAPYLSNIGIGRGVECGHVIAPWSVRYANGAKVPTSFVTNLDPGVVAESAPDLRDLVRAADEAGRRETVRELPKYDYPDAIVTSAGLGYLASHGTAFRVRRGDCAYVRKLDAQGDKAIFGGGLLLSTRAAAERAAAERAAAERAAAERAAAEHAAAEHAAAERYDLSPRERRIQSMLPGVSPPPTAH